MILSHNTTREAFKNHYRGKAQFVRAYLAITHDGYFLQLQEDGTLVCHSCIDELSDCLKAMVEQYLSSQENRKNNYIKRNQVKAEFELIKGERLSDSIIKSGDCFYFRRYSEIDKKTKDELTDEEQSKIDYLLSKKEEEARFMKEYFGSILPAKEKLIAYVQEHGTLSDRSNVSESEYWHCKGIDGMTYTVRISGHVHPTGSMTSSSLNKIDTTDYDCRRYLSIFGL